MTTTETALPLYPTYPSSGPGRTERDRAYAELLSAWLPAIMQGGPDAIRARVDCETHLAAQKAGVLLGYLRAGHFENDLRSAMAAFELIESEPVEAVDKRQASAAKQLAAAEERLEKARVSYDKAANAVAAVEADQRNRAEAEAVVEKMRNHQTLGPSFRELTK